MPNFDGTGPQGKGPKTGQQSGKCEGAQPQENLTQGRGRRFFGRCGRQRQNDCPQRGQGMGRGAGRGAGQGRGFGQQVQNKE